MCCRPGRLPLSSAGPPDGIPSNRNLAARGAHHPFAPGPREERIMPHIETKEMMGLLMVALMVLFYFRRG